MLSYPHRPPSGHITCYLNRTYHVLTTVRQIELADGWNSVLALRPIDASAGLEEGWQEPVRASVAEKATSPKLEPW